MLVPPRYESTWVGWLPDIYEASQTIQLITSNIEFREACTGGGGGRMLIRGGKKDGSMSPLSIHGTEYHFSNGVFCKHYLKHKLKYVNNDKKTLKFYFLCYDICINSYNSLTFQHLRHKLTIRLQSRGMNHTP